METNISRLTHFQVDSSGGGEGVCERFCKRARWTVTHTVCDTRSHYLDVVDLVDVLDEKELLRASFDVVR